MTFLYDLIHIILYHMIINVVRLGLAEDGVPFQIPCIINLSSLAHLRYDHSKKLLPFTSLNGCSRLKARRPAQISGCDSVDWWLEESLTQNQS